MSYHIARDFLSSKLTLDQLATLHNIPKSEVVKAISRFIRRSSSKELKELAERKLKVAIASAFISFTGHRDDFAKTYGMSEEKLISTIKEVIEDRSIVKSDADADKLFRRLTLFKIFSVASIPPRILHYIGYLYVNSNLSQSSLAASYGIHQTSISNILCRGIAENIYDDDLANKVYYKVSLCKYMTSKNLKAYSLAFDKREQSAKV